MRVYWSALQWASTCDARNGPQGRLSPSGVPAAAGSWEPRARNLRAGGGWRRGVHGCRAPGALLLGRRRQHNTAPGSPGRNLRAACASTRARAPDVHVAWGRVRIRTGTGTGVRTAVGVGARKAEAAVSLGSNSGRRRSAPRPGPGSWCAYIPARGYAAAAGAARAHAHAQSPAFFIFVLGDGCMVVRRIPRQCVMIMM